MSVEWTFDDQKAELLNRIKESEAERDAAIERTSTLVEALAQQWVDRSKAEGERDAAISAEIDRERSSDAEIQQCREAAAELVRGANEQAAEAIRRVRELEAELFEWRGCPACHTDHGPNSTCPPHEVRPTGLDSAGWQYGLWRGRTRAANQRAEKAETERDEALAEVASLKQIVAKLSELLEMAAVEPTLDAAHLECDRKRDEALKEECDR